MAKGRKKKLEGEDIVKEKKTSLFDMISFITDQKKPWDSLSDEEQKLFNPYMMNRFLSMDMFLIEAINELQKYTVGVMNKKDVYNLFLHYIPKQKYYLKYLRPVIDIPAEDLKYISLYYNVSEREAEDYYFILIKDEVGKEHLESIKNSYHYDKR